MSNKALTWAWETDVPPTDRLVLLCLADHHNATTGQCNPGPDRIARRTGLSRATIFRALAKLEAKGLISRDEAGLVSLAIGGEHE